MLKRIGLFLIVNILVVLTVSIVLSILGAVFGFQPAGLIGLAILAGLIGMGGALVSLLISRWIAKKFHGLQLIDERTSDPNARRLYEMVSRLSKQAGISTMPEVAIYSAPEPNAFATGPSKDKALVACSTGLLQSMNDREVEAVLGHEISHVTNGDMTTMTLLTGVMNSLVIFLAHLAAMAIDNFLSGEEEGEGGGLGIIGYFIVVNLLEMALMPLAAIPIAAFSRRREYRADAGAARLTSAEAMINALRRLSQAVQPEQPKHQEDSFALAKINSGRRVSLWASHPPIEERIKNLQRNH